MKNLYQHLHRIYWAVRRGWCATFHVRDIDIVSDYRTARPGQRITRGDFLVCTACTHVMNQFVGLQAVRGS